ncbi:O-antigen ligase family protein [Vibrio alginolyticus]
MILNELQKENHRHIELLLGLALGTGYLTKYRIFGPVGISELLFLFFIIWLIVKFSRSRFRNINKTDAYLSLFFVFSIFFIAPIVSVTSYFDGINKIDFQYLPSFMMGIVLMLYLTDAIENGLCLRRVTLIFALVFICSNVFFITTGTVSGSRYSGGSLNPNQLLFYATSLSILSSIYLSKSKLPVIILISCIMIYSGSDTYLLAIFVSLFMLIFSSTIFSRRVSFTLSVIFGLILLLTIFSIISYYYIDDIRAIWQNADEGNTRLTLYMNAINVVVSSPVFGYGVGSFSGLTNEFQGKEAHNTFLDFSSQFGVVFTSLLYIIMIRYTILAIKKRMFLLAGFCSAYIISTFFHFSGRHFVFWVEMGLFYHFIVSSKYKKWDEV